MKASCILLLLVAAGVAAPVWAKPPKNSGLPRIVCPAQFVYVETMDGDILRPEVIPEDRDAVSRVQDKLRDWGRYVLVYNPQSSDIVLAVRTGRLATQQTAVGISRGRRRAPAGPGGGGNIPAGAPPDASQAPDAHGPAPAYPPFAGNSRGAGTNGDVGPPDDLLAVYTKPGDVNNQSPLWRKTAKDGLDGPRVPLFEQVRSAIDKACQDDPKAKSHP